MFVCLKHIVLDWKALSVNVVNHSPLQLLLDEYTSIFQEMLGMLKGFEATIHVDPNAQPVYCRALRDQVNAEIR